MSELVIKAKYQIGDVLKGTLYNRPVTIIVKGIVAHVTAEGQQIEYEPSEQDADYLPEENVIGRMVLEGDTNG